MSKLSAKIASYPKSNLPIFIDTAIFIYLLEDHEQYSLQLSELFDQISLGKIQAVTSLITLSELLVKPYELAGTAKAEEYRGILTSFPNLQMIGISEQVAMNAAKIRAKYTFSLIDSLQLAIAEDTKAKLFLTNDKQLKKYPDLPILYLDDVR